MNTSTQLQHVTVRFTRCKFTYSSLAFDQDYFKPKKQEKKGKRAKVMEMINKMNPIEVVNFDNCSFNPVDESKLKNLFERGASVLFVFSHCKFIPRRMSKLEMLIQHLRKFFDIPPNYNIHPLSPQIIDIEHQTFRLKEIPKVMENVFAKTQKRMLV